MQRCSSDLMQGITRWIMQCAKRSRTVVKRCSAPGLRAHFPHRAPENAAIDGLTTQFLSNAPLVSRLIGPRRTETQWRLPTSWNITRPIRLTVECRSRGQNDATKTISRWFATTSPFPSYWNYLIASHNLCAHMSDKKIFIFLNEYEKHT
jgi:hypothetical protein